MKSFYILGGSGFMGGLFIDYLKAKGHTVYSDKIAIEDLNALRTAFTEKKPDVVVNFAGVRAQPHIDWCEDHKEETTLVNVAGSINVMIAAMEVGAYPIQIASGCIYDSGVEKACTEEDTPNFTGSYYSRMRIAQQIAMQELPLLYARIRMPLCAFPHPRNFITKIAGYEKVINIPNSMTLLEDLFVALEDLSTREEKVYGILNLTNDGWVDHKTVLDAYKNIVKPDHTYIQISLEELQGPGGITKAKRSNCILSSKKAESLGLSFPALTPERMNKVMEIYKKYEEGAMDLMTSIEELTK